MPISRFYQAMPLVLHERVILDTKASHHLIHVLRAKEGDPIVLFNGDGGEYQAIIERIYKKEVAVHLQAFNPREAESTLNLCLAQGIARGEKMDFIIQKSVELGVKQIVPLFTERCAIKWDATRTQKRLQHWQAVVISACEQSGRNHLPEITLPIQFETWLTQKKPDYVFILSPHVSATISTYSLPAHAAISLVAGPEGGLSDAEVQFAMTQGALPLKIGARILRTETASLVGLSVLQTRFGDFI